MPDLLLRFGVRHPLQWQAGFLLGQVHSQMGEYAPAAEVYTRAYDGQRIALGPGHPHTLRTQFELGITLKVVGQSRRAAAMIRAVRLTAPASVGRNTDLCTGSPRDRAAVAAILAVALDRHQGQATRIARTGSNG